MGLNPAVVVSFAVAALPFVLLATVPFASLVRYAGLATLAYLAFAVARWVHLTFVAANSLAAYRRDGTGKAWALVTGASDGIGKAFGAELLRRGFNVILLGRNEQKLNAVATELQGALPDGNDAVARYVVADAERAADPALFAHILAETKRHVGTGALTLLVNNVGIEVLKMGLLHEQALPDMDRMLAVNALFPTKLTALLLPLLAPVRDTQGAMVAQTARRSAVIHVSSFSSCIAAPFLSVYAATKAYNNAFSAAQRLEYAPFGIDVLCITPSFVASAMTGTDTTTLERCSARACASGSLDKLGVAGASHVSPYWYHALQELLAVHVYPRALVERMVYATLKGNADRHKRKREQKAKEDADKAAAAAAN